LKTRRQSIAEGVAMVHKLASALDNHSSSDEDDAMGEIEEEHSGSSSGGDGEIVWEDGDQFDPYIENNRDQDKLAWLFENIESDLHDGSEDHSYPVLTKDEFASFWNDFWSDDDQGKIADSDSKSDEDRPVLLKTDLFSFWEDEGYDAIYHATPIFSKKPVQITAPNKSGGVSFAPLIATEQDRSEEKNEEDVIDGMYDQESEENEEEDRERTRTSSSITRKLEEQMDRLHAASDWDVEDNSV
jgi:hypothetical protein